MFSNFITSWCNATKGRNDNIQFNIPKLCKKLINHWPFQIKVNNIFKHRFFRLFHLLPIWWFDQPWRPSFLYSQQIFLFPLGNCFNNAPFCKTKIIYWINIHHKIVNPVVSLKMQKQLPAPLESFSSFSASSSSFLADVFSSELLSSSGSLCYRYQSNYKNSLSKLANMVLENS